MMRNHPRGIVACLLLASSSKCIMTAGHLRMARFLLLQVLCQRILCKYCAARLACFMQRILYSICANVQYCLHYSEVVDVQYMCKSGCTWRAKSICSMITLGYGLCCLLVAYARARSLLSYASNVHFLGNCWAKGAIMLGFWICL